MGLAQEEHAEARLSDPPSDGLWELAAEQQLVPEELAPFLQLADFQLLKQGVRVDADAHRGDLEGAFEQLVPDDDVPVKSAEAVRRRSDPVVVVGGAAVMDFSVGHDPTDPDDKYGPIFSGHAGFPVAGCQFGIPLRQLFGMEESDLLGQARFDMRIVILHEVFGAYHGGIDLPDGLF